MSLSEDLEENVIHWESSRNPCRLKKHQRNTDRWICVAVAAATEMTRFFPVKRRCEEKSQVRVCTGRKNDMQSKNGAVLAVRNRFMNTIWCLFLIFSLSKISNNFPTWGDGEHSAISWNDRKKTFFEKIKAKPSSCWEFRSVVQRDE